MKSLGMAVWLVLMMAIVGCEKKITNWVPSLENFDRLPYKQVHRIRELGGRTDFEITVASQNQSLIKRVTAENFSVEILPLEDPVELPRDRSGSGVVVDGQSIEHKEHSFPDQSSLGAPSPIFIKVHALAKEEPSRFRLNLHSFPAAERSVVINAGHYKSLVLRRSGSGASYVRFYHHHGDWRLHVLYEGWFYRCTYAYDCNPGHSIPSWWTSKGDESVEFRADCYGRCS